MENKKIAYIIPLHKEDDRVFRAIESVPDDATIIVSLKHGLKSWFTKTKTQAEIVESDGSSYPILVNAGLKFANNLSKFDLISILEYDDTIMPNAHKIINEYSTDWEDVEIYCPLTCIVVEEEGSDKPTLIGVSNEASMAPQVAEEFGYFDFNMMLKTNFIFLNGCYIKPSVFENYGKIKENFELFYDYEFLLRVVYNGGIIRSIPKSTHFHTINNSGAFEIQKALPKETRDNWLNVAKREYFFEEDREINFE